GMSGQTRHSFLAESRRAGSFKYFDHTCFLTISWFTWRPAPNTERWFMFRSVLKTSQQVLSARDSSQPAAEERMRCRRDSESSELLVGWPQQAQIASSRHKIALAAHRWVEPVNQQFCSCCSFHTIARITRSRYALT